MEKKELCDKYNLMDIAYNKLDQIVRDKVGNGVHVALLYGMPVILNRIGKNNISVQSTVSDLSKYNHPSLALNYGYMIERENPSSEGEYSENDTTYIVRELVKGKNFHNIGSFHYHDRLVLLYKLACLLEFLHSFNVYYLFLHPSKIIITDDIEVKLVDHIKINDDKHTIIKTQPLNDEARFIYPDLFSQIDKIDKLDNKTKLYIDLYSFGCIAYYSMTGELPWGNKESKEEIVDSWLSTVSNNNSYIDFLREENTYNSETKKLYNLIEKLLTGKYDNTEEVRVALESLPEVQEYLKDGTLKFDFDSECKKVVENINQLVQEIEKLFDEKDLPRHFNTIHQSKLKFSNNQEIDFTKAKKNSFINKSNNLFPDNK